MRPVATALYGAFKYGYIGCKISNELSTNTSYISALIEDLKESVKKAKNSLAIREEQINILNDLVTTPNNTPTKISLHTSEKIVIVDINNIIKCKSDSNYTTFYFKDKSKIMVSKTLKYYSDLLKDNNFIRVHQSYLINKEYIKEFIKSDGGYLVLQDNTNVPVSSRKKPEIISILKDT